MNDYLSLFLIVYIVGVVVVLLRWRNNCLGGWFQTLITAVVWPVVLCVVFYEKDRL